MTTYAIALINISDRSEYAAYEKGFMEIFEQYQGKVLAVEEAPVVKEGTWPYTRTVLAEFPSQAEFDRWYHSDAYQALAKHRFAASRASIALLRSV
jgi:uncharacterized protein (DUF1330 family)